MAQNGNLPAFVFSKAIAGFGSATGDSCGELLLSKTTRRLVAMAARFWTKALTIVALLMLIGNAGTGLAQLKGVGSLSGKLTDTYSKPLENVTVTVRNAVTGVEAATRTAKGGMYRFTGLGPGEYRLRAESAEGAGQVDGIVVSLGHEARVQTAIELKRPPEPLLAVGAGPEKIHDEVPTASAAVSLTAPTISRAVIELTATQLPARLRGIAVRLEITQPASSIENLELASEPLVNLVLSETPSLQPAVAKVTDVDQRTLEIASADRPSAVADAEQRRATVRPIAERAIANQLIAAASGGPHPATVILAPSLVAGGALPRAHVKIVSNSLGSALVELGLIEANLRLVKARHPAQLSAVRFETSASAPETLTASELQALPVSGRNWQTFVLDTPPGAVLADADEGRGSGRVDQATTVDGSSIGLAFGGTGVGRGAGRAASLIGPAASESGIREVRSQDRLGGSSAIRSTLSHTDISTQHGADVLHGQVFIFEKQNVWGAKNPFTQWVKESAPATPDTTPTFVGQPYSPSNREATLGAGIGGALRRDKLFWFASLDSDERDHPGVSSVKHPESFFAQPSNDQMQVLSARLGLSSVDPVSEGIGAYSKMLETLSGLLGPATRTSSQWSGFARIDWTAAERHRFTLEGTGARLDAPGGGLTAASENYGTHSFGSSRAREEWVLGRWEAFLTSNLLAVTQASFGRQITNADAASPSTYEQTLNVNGWGQLPQIVVDSRYGFSIGNPARFGTGSYPDERLFKGQEQLSWVHSALLLNAGIEINHNTDATSRLLNQTGTYHYSSVENFVSDALAFESFGFNGQLNPMQQHNCDETGRVWRDSTQVLHGLGYLPCYSYYTQTMGPSNWWLNTNDWAAYGTSQWQPKKRLVLSLAMRWDREQLPRPIAALNNPKLPLTQQLPSLGNNWGPRASFAWGSGESHWPLLRVGYGMYFGRTPNMLVETALTQTGSFKGDLNFFMRPTDNLRGGGAPPFPYVLAGEPSSVVKPGVVEFAPGFRNGEIHQAEAAVEETLPGHVRLIASTAVSLGRRLPVTVDANIDPTLNPQTITYAIVDGNRSGPINTPKITVPFYASWPSPSSPTGYGGRLNPDYQQVTEISSRANSTYEAATVHLSRSARGLAFHVKYTYAHAMDWNPNESAQASGGSMLDPANFAQEYGTSNLDIRHSLSGTMILAPQWKLANPLGRLSNGWMISGIGRFHSGLPYSMRAGGSLAKEFGGDGAPIVALGSGMNGYGGDNRVYGVGRNTYRYPATWKADLRLSKKFNLGHMRQLELLAESFNFFNHQNVTAIETTGYSIESGSVHGGLPTLNFMTGLKKGKTEFGQPLSINAVDSYRERQFQFGTRFRF